METTAEFIQQGIDFTTTEHRIEMGKQEAEALRIATAWNALQFFTEDDICGWDVRLIGNTANKY